MSVDAAAQGIELAKNGFPDGLDVPFDFMMEKTGIDPKIQIEKINAEISEREKNILTLQEKIAKAQGNLVDARARTKVAKDAKKKMELEKNQKQPTAQQT